MTPPAPILLEEAQSRLLEVISTPEQESLGIDAMQDRYLAKDIHAKRTQPAADLSAMDGYVIREDDVAGPWSVVGESAAGHPFSGSLAKGEAIRISTGALMPDDGGLVLLQENVTRDGNNLSLNGEGEPTSRHIRKIGFDFRQGDLLLQQGMRMNAARIALCISGGNPSISCFARPSLAIIDSGDELADSVTDIDQHQIPASNGDMLEAMAAPYTSQILRLGPVKDNLPNMLAALDKAQSCSMIVTSGGASVGDHDLVRPALAEWGAEIDFWRIAMKPGKPLMVACKGVQTILGLPGNPVSAFVTAYLFLLPALRKMNGSSSPLPACISLPLAGELPPTGKRTEFVRARLLNGQAVPLTEQDSSGIRALAQADILIRRDIGAPKANAGDIVQCYLLENGGIA